MSLLSFLIELAQFLKKTKGGSKMNLSLRETKPLAERAEQNVTEITKNGHYVKTIKNTSGCNGFNFPITVDQKTFDFAHSFCEQEYINFGILEQGEKLSPSDAMCVAMRNNQEIAGTLAFSSDLYFREYYRESFPKTAFVLSKFSLSSYLRKEKEEQQKVVRLLFKTMRKLTIRYYKSYGSIRPPIFLETHPAVVKIFHNSIGEKFLIPQNVSLLIENTPKKSAGFYNIPGVTVYEIDQKIFS